MPTTTSGAEQQVYEHNGMHWKRLPDCASTFDELLQARSRWMEIFRETRWNPWRTEELADEQEHARDVMRRWMRAEPDHRYLTKRELGARQGAITRKHNARYKADQERWERDKQHYDPERENARFALLEREAIRARQTRELDAYRSGERFPSMAADRRAKEIDDLEAKLSTNEAEIVRLSDVVGEREEVLDEEGRLPRDRRLGSLISYGIRRHDQVPKLQQSTAELRECIKGTKNRAEKSKLDAQLWSEDRHLQALLLVPILSAEEMCADCCFPQYQHASGGETHESRPCPRWPHYAAQMERVWEILRSASKQTKPGEPEPPKLQPLATLPGNLAITELIDRLSALQQEHPNAVVSHGRANRWKLWPKKQ